MIDTVPRPDASLPEFIAARARHTSDGWLAVLAGSGFVVALLALWWRGPAWYLVASLAVVVLAFGAWGITDREIAERHMPGELTAPQTERRAVFVLQVLRATRAACAVLGILGAAVLLLAFLGVALGRMIS